MGGERSWEKSGAETPLHCLGAFKGLGLVVPGSTDGNRPFNA